MWDHAKPRGKVRAPRRDQRRLPLTCHFCLQWGKQRGSGKARKRERRERKRRGVRQIHRNSKEVRDGERREMVEETEGEMGRDKHRGQD